MRQFLGTFIQDFRYSLRSLRKSPLFAAVVILTFGVGTGANTAVFSAAEAIWLRPLGITDVTRTVMLGEQTTRSKEYSVAPATYSEWRQNSHSFSAISAYRQITGNVGGIGAPQRVQAAVVDDGFFRLLEMNPELGRKFSHDDFQGKQKVAILSYSFWEGNFGGSRDVVGKTFQFDGHATVVIGVMGKENVFPPATDLWIPLYLTASEWADTKVHSLSPLGRLRDGVTRGNAASELHLLLRQVAKLAPNDYEDVRPAVDSLNDVINGNMTPGLLSVLLGATFFVLLIACVNVGDLQLARAIARRKEFAVRAALGSGRGRIARQLMTESMVLAVSGAGVGLLIAYWAVRVMVNQLPTDTARYIVGWSEMGIDIRVLFFSIAVAVVAGVISGVLPLARGLQFVPGDALKTASGSPPTAPHRIRAILVVGEAALAVTLLVGTALVLQAFRRTAASTAEFTPTTLLSLEVELPPTKYSSPALKANFYAQALELLRAIPGVTEAATFSAMPFSNNGVAWQNFRTSTMEPRRHLPAAILQSISPGYLRIMHIPLLNGRDFLISDGPSSPGVAIISEVMARQYWPGKSPIGQQVLLHDTTTETPLTIIGVSGTVVYDWTDNAPERVIYVPFSQRPQMNALLAVRSTEDTSILVPEIRSTMAQLDADLPLSNMKRMDRLLLESLAGLFQIESLLSGFGFLALLLSTTGVYGMASYTATLRKHEVGIRMAVGADRRAVLRLMVGQTMRLLVIGIAIGLLGAIALGRVIQGFFFGATAANPWSFASACGLLCLSGLLATFGPAWRSTRVDPVVTLRS